MFKNLGLKLLAFLMAVVFWIGVIAFKNNIKPFKEEVLIEPFNLADNLILDNDLEGVNLKIEASQETLSSLSVNSFKAYVDLKGLEAGEYNLPVQVTSKNPQVKIVKFEPDNVSVIIEQITSKILNLTVDVKGAAAENFEAQEPEYDLKEVEVRGAKNVIEKVTEVKALVNLKGLETNDLKTEVSLFAYDDHKKQLSGVEIMPSTISLTIPVVQIQQNKTIGVKANLVGDVAEGFFVKTILVSPSTVNILGDTKDLMQLDVVETEEVDIEGLNHDTTKRVVLKLPESVLTESVQEQSVLVNVKLGKY